eukprot:4408782-Amphidinium_carterae.1
MRAHTRAHVHARARVLPLREPFFVWTTSCLERGGNVWPTASPRNGSNTSVLGSYKRSTVLLQRAFAVHVPSALRSPTMTG